MQKLYLQIYTQWKIWWYIVESFGELINSEQITNSKITNSKLGHCVIIYENVNCITHYDNLTPWNTCKWAHFSQAVFSPIPGTILVGGIQVSIAHSALPYITYNRFIGRFQQSHSSGAALTATSYMDRHVQGKHIISLKEDRFWKCRKENSH